MCYPTLRKSIRPEKLYLTDIVEACSSIEKFCDGISFDKFRDDDMRRVWLTATEEVPVLHYQVETILREEFRD